MKLLLMPGKRNCVGELYILPWITDEVCVTCAGQTVQLTPKAAGFEVYHFFGARFNQSRLLPFQKSGRTDR